MPNSDKSIILKHVGRAILFFAIIFLLQWLVGNYISIPIGPEAVEFRNFNLLNKYMSTHTDVLYFGDSTDWYTADNDTDNRSIGRLLTDELPQIRIKKITHAAYHLGVYASFCKYIVSKKEEQYPKLIVLPINLRSFSPHWDLEPGYQFNRERISLEGGILKAFYRPLRIFKYKFHQITRTQYKNTPIFYENQKVGTIKSMRGNKNQFILRYMYPLSHDHRKLKSLKKIATLLSTHHIKAFFYITPVDYQSGEKSHPDKFKRQIQNHIQLIRNECEKFQFPLLDLSTDLTEKYFAWKHKGAPNEHLNQEGRKYVAKKIAHKIRSLLSVTH